MSEAYTIGLKIAAYEALREQADELAAQLKEINSRKDAAEDDVISTLLDIQDQTGAENMRIEYEGRNYSVTTKSYYTIPKAKKDEAFEAMRDLGMGDLIQEKVDDRTLTKELEAVREDHDGELPDEYAPLLDMVSTYTKSALRRVKA